MPALLGIPGCPLQVPGLVLDPTSMSMATHTLLNLYVLVLTPRIRIGT